MGLQRRQSIVAKLARRPAQSFGAALHEIVNQRLHILAALTERRHGNRHHIQSMIEILAKSSAGNLFAQIAAARGHNPDIHFHRPSAAHSLELLLDQNPQHLALRLERHVRHFI